MPSQAWPPRVMFLYWGRRGALSRFTYEVARAALSVPGLNATVSVSRQNEGFARFLQFGEALFPVDTFETGYGALTQAWRIPRLRRRLAARLAQDRTEAVVELMPHVWSPLVLPVVRRAGLLYATVIHDASSHPGDHTALAKPWTDRAVRQADLILTLSRSVANRLASEGKAPKGRLRVLFHPDLDYGIAAPEPPRPGTPLRLVFFGRLMAYKGLPLFLDAVDQLRKEGVDVHVGVFGEGALGPTARRLTDMGAEVVNRWLTDEEIAALLPRFHAVVLAHTEASQSGVAATALGAGLPIVATPVGGLVEQVADGVTGVLAERVDASALAEGIKRLLLDDTLYRAVCKNIAHSREERSMAKFVEACLNAIGASQQQRPD
jgi:glycosyltransferase involved in cell wall biosynthesis